MVNCRIYLLRYKNFEGLKVRLLTVYGCQQVLLVRELKKGC